MIRHIRDVAVKRFRSSYARRPRFRSRQRSPDTIVGQPGRADNGLWNGAARAKVPRAPD